MNAKRVKDASEIYDGVPSMHDAKSATIISYSKTKTKEVGTLKIRDLPLTIFPLKLEVFPL